MTLAMIETILELQPGELHGLRLQPWFPAPMVVAGAVELYDPRDFDEWERR